MSNEIDTNKLQSNNQLVDRKVAAKFLGVKVQTLAGWAITNKNIPYVKVGRLVKYRVSDLEAFIEHNLKHHKPQN